VWGTGNGANGRDARKKGELRKLDKGGGDNREGKRITVHLRGGESDGHQCPQYGPGSVAGSEKGGGGQLVRGQEKKGKKKEQELDCEGKLPLRKRKWKGKERGASCGAKDVWTIKGNARD